LAYFFSILSNVTLWALLWFAVAASGMTTTTEPAVTWHQTLTTDHFTTHSTETVVVMTRVPLGVVAAILFGLVRVLVANGFQTRLMRSSAHTNYFWLVPIKDLLHAAIWFCAFLGNRVEWRGQKFKLRSDGTLERK
jgi:hypothetical protein